jgi:hypothetical protein
LEEEIEVANAKASYEQAQEWQRLKGGVHKMPPALSMGYSAHPNHTTLASAEVAAMFLPTPVLPLGNVGKHYTTHHAVTDINCITGHDGWWANIHKLFSSTHTDRRKHGCRTSRRVYQRYIKNCFLFVLFIQHTISY